MDYCRLKVKDGGIHIPITQEAFEVATAKKPPYYQKDASGNMKLYALCPACENPVTIVGFYKKNDPHVKRPHGRHRASNVSNLANYNPQAYEICPLASKLKTFDKSKRRPRTFDKLANDIRNLLINHFDRVVYILQKCTGIYFSRKMLKSMLQSYWAADGHFYHGATLENVPWIFAYMTTNQNLYGQRIYKDSLIAKAIDEKCKNITLHQIANTSMVKILPRTDTFIQLTFAFVAHKKTTSNSKVVESMTLMVWNNHKPILEQKIVFTTDYWFRLVNYDNERHRQPELIMFAKCNT